KEQRRKLLLQARCLPLQLFAGGIDHWRSNRRGWFRIFWRSVHWHCGDGRRRRRDRDRRREGCRRGREKKLFGFDRRQNSFRFYWRGSDCWFYRRRRNRLRSSRSNSIRRETHPPKSDCRLGEFQLYVSARAAIVLRFHHLANDFLLGLLVGEEQKLSRRNSRIQAHKPACSEPQHPL